MDKFDMARLIIEVIAGLMCLGCLLIICMGLLIIFISPIIGVGDSSTGIRTGELVKVSERGWFWKTGEAELVMNSFSETGAYVFKFSFDKTQVAEMQGKIGKQILITYESPKLFWKWNQKSGYMMKKLKVIE